MSFGLLLRRMSVAGLHLASSLPIDTVSRPERTGGWAMFKKSRFSPLVLGIFELGVAVRLSPLKELRSVLANPCQRV